MKSILFLTTLNLASNPRLVKEIDLALSQNFKVTVICFEFVNWSKNNNDVLLSRFGNVKFVLIPADSKPIFSWINNTLKEKFYRILSYFTQLPVSMLSQAVSKRSDMLIREFNKAKLSHIDLVIGHNPGALFPAFYAAKKLKAKVGFDVEDYHPGEGHNTSLKKNTFKLMKLLPRFDYVSFASQLIQKKTESDLHTKNDNWFTVLNYFPSNEFIEPQKITSEKIKFVWFSQNITFGRGLEEFLDLFMRLDNVELHLYGKLDESFNANFLSVCYNLIIHEPVSQLVLHKELSDYDIGLALDVANDENRDLAITNKILAYLQAGLFIVASGISAHKYVMSQYENHGVYLSDNLSLNQNLIKGILDNIFKIREKKICRFKNFKNKNWETESILLIKKWNKLMNQ